MSCRTTPADTWEWWGTLCFSPCGPSHISCDPVALTCRPACERRNLATSRYFWGLTTTLRYPPWQAQGKGGSPMWMSRDPHAGEAPLRRGWTATHGDGLADLEGQFMSFLVQTRGVDVETAWFFKTIVEREYGESVLVQAVADLA